MEKHIDYYIDETTHTLQEYKDGVDMEWRDVLEEGTKAEAIRYAKSYLGNRKSTNGVRVDRRDSTEGKEEMTTVFTKFIK